MHRARLLLELQSVDLRRDDAVRRLKVVMAKLQGSPEVQAARRELEAADAELADVDHALRGDSQQRDALRERIAGEEAKLYGGRVTAPKELQNLEREVESFKKQLSALEDRVLEHMLRRDEALARQRTAKSAVAAAEADSAEAMTALTGEKQDLARRIRAIDVERAEVAAGVSAADAKVYDRLRPLKERRPVASLKSDECGECGIQVPRSTRTQAEAQAGLVFCPGCGRVLST
jgi:predicted  nucleic acid-binding Zn-ribbon protein